MEKQVIEVHSEEENDESDGVVIIEDEETDVSPRRKEIGGTSRRHSTDINKFEEYLGDKLNPSFPVDLMTQERMRIPARVIKDYNLKFPKSVIVRDNIGELKRKVAVWKNKSVFLNGVGSIRRRNHVKRGDKVVCELNLVDDRHGLVREIKVHIIKE